MSLAASAPATAQVDMTGAWFVRVFPIFLRPVDCAIDMVQTGTALSISSSDCPFLVTMNLTGSIDPMTGDFTASGSSTACSQWCDRRRCRRGCDDEYREYSEEAKRRQGRRGLER